MGKHVVNRLTLTEKQYLYVSGLRAGKSKLQAGLDAGYTRHSACNAAYNIERRGRGGEPVQPVMNVC